MDNIEPNTKNMIADIIGKAVADRPFTGFGATKGKKSLSVLATETKYNLHKGSIEAAAYIVKLVSGKVQRPSPTRLDACKFIIEQVLGKARQAQEIGRPGEFDYKDIVDDAAMILADSGEDGVVEVEESLGDSSEESPDDEEDMPF